MQKQLQQQTNNEKQKTKNKKKPDKMFSQAENSIRKNKTKKLKKA